MTIDSVFRIASITKTLTSTAAMQLVERRQLRLDQRICELLPELVSPQVLEGFDPSGEPRLRPAKRPITLRHLLTHTAGFGYAIWNPDLLRYEERTGTPRTISGKKRALSMPLTFDPGDDWGYGINIDWAGKLVERVSGLKLGQFFRENLFEPLGMNDSMFELGVSQRERLVSMHVRHAHGKLAPIAFQIPQEAEFQAGGVGLYSTAGDCLSFATMFLNEGRGPNGRQILKPETVRLMSENQIGALYVRPFKTTAPFYSNDVEFFPGTIKKWGLGFMINTEPAPTGRSAGSLAWAGLGNTYFWIDPAKGVVGVIMMQLLPFADTEALELYGTFEKAVYDEFA